MVKVWWVKRNLDLGAGTIIYELYNSTTSSWVTYSDSGVKSIYDLFEDFVNEVGIPNTSLASWDYETNNTIYGRAVVSDPNTKFRFSNNAISKQFAKEIGFSETEEYDIPKDNEELVAPFWGVSRLVIGSETRLETRDGIPIGNSQFIKPLDIDEYGANAGGDVYKDNFVMMKWEYNLVINSYETDDMKEAVKFFTNLVSKEVTTMTTTTFDLLAKFGTKDAQLYQIAPFPEKANQKDRYKINFVRVEKI